MKKITLTCFFNPNDPQVRCFPTKGSTVTHVMDTIDPIRDINIIENELRLKDIQLLSSLKKLKKGGVRVIFCTRVTHPSLELQMGCQSVRKSP